MSKKTAVITPRRRKPALSSFDWLAIRAARRADTKQRDFLDKVSMHLDVDEQELNRVFSFASSDFIAAIERLSRRLVHTPMGKNPSIRSIRLKDHLPIKIRLKQKETA